MRDCERRISLDALPCDVVTRLTTERDGALASLRETEQRLAMWMDRAVEAERQRDEARAKLLSY